MSMVLGEMQSVLLEVMAHFHIGGCGQRPIPHVQSLSCVRLFASNHLLFRKKRQKEIYLFRLLLNMG